ncbi:hypothetical protein [Frigoriglobus tundricola]|uniref:Uncharacterized protein n=1 Tax=Frigoriglobus tundricola TaxID=2774151 RepID=A0A6M5YFQ8_9BACT|nr:hypothetical protein [Frigoriglobus tundricola]QJW92847.1 hypothetical protein FTUN_0344 [Frigoriglobus tundricola]
MLVPFILAVCMCGVFCLIPLTMYLLWLARITRRDHPAAVSGSWDLAGLVLGLSGFIVFGGGLLLTLLQSNFRYLMRGNFEALRAAWVQEKLTWSLLVCLYLIFVLGGIGLTYLSRRRALVVYNIEPVEFETMLVEVFEQIGRSVTRRGKVWGDDAALCELDEFDAGRTVTLRWLSHDERLFEEVERRLRAAVATHPADDNPASRWLMSGAVGSGTIVMCCFGLLVFYISLLGR